MIEDIMRLLRELRARLGLHPTMPATVNRLRLAWEYLHPEPQEGIFVGVEGE